MNIFYLPDLGEGLAEAEIHEWYVKEGDIVKADHPMISLETAKAVVDVPVPQPGKIKKLFGRVGDIVQTGSPLVEFEGEENTSVDKGTVVGSLEESNSIFDADDMIIGSASKAINSVKAMPAVRALAKQLNVDLNIITPTGSRQQITIDDVKKAAKNQKVNTNAEALHGARRVMAMTMSQSHQEVVPVTIFDDADITSFSSDADITVQVIQAMVAGLKAEPSLNAWYDGSTMERCLLQEVHLGIAMNTEQGLFVPVIKQAHHLSATELRKIINQFKQTVRDRSIIPSELQGATIILSNFGMMAGRYATPIVVPPMVAILGCGKIREAVMPYEGRMAIRRILPLSLSFDHRAVTGGEAGQFLAVVIKILEGIN